MAGILPDEGENLVANLVFKGDQTYEMGLFTNTTISETTTAASLTEPIGGGYARKALLAGNWTVAGNVASYPTQSFTAGVGGYTGSIYGYFIVSIGGSPKIIDIALRPEGNVTMAENNVYQVTTNITVS